MFHKGPSLTHSWIKVPFSLGSVVLPLLSCQWQPWKPLLLAVQIARSQGQAWHKSQHTMKTQDPAPESSYHRASLICETKSRDQEKKSPVIAQSNPLEKEDGESQNLGPTNTAGEKVEKPTNNSTSLLQNNQAAIYNLLHGLVLHESFCRPLSIGEVT